MQKQLAESGQETSEAARQTLNAVYYMVMPIAYRLGYPTEGNHLANTAFCLLDAEGYNSLQMAQVRHFGSDTEAVRYDGTYVYNERSGLADVKIKVTFPPNVEAVFGISNPYEWAFDVTTSIDPKKDAGVVQVKTSIGKSITAQFVFLRSLPEAA